MSIFGPLFGALASIRPTEHAATINVFDKVDTNHLLGSKRCLVVNRLDHQSIPQSSDIFTNMQRFIQIMGDEDDGFVKRPASPA